MLRILDSSLHLLAVFDKVLICKTREVLNDAYLLNFTVTVDKSKSQYLYDSNNIILVGDDYFKVYKLKEVHKTGQTVTIDIQAEHLSYKLLESTVNNFNMTDTIMNIGATIVCPSGFNYESDFTETVNVKVDGTATRKALLLALANQCTGELDYWKNNIRLMRSIGENTIYAKFGNNINEITREQDFYNKTINYTINLIDTTNPNLKDLKRANLGDTVIVTDEELGIASVEKKVIEIERDYILGIHTKVTLGDPLPKIIEAIKKNIEVGNVITEVIHEQVINVETAHILNAWIKNLFVEYVETNMNARLDRTTTDRYFIRIKEEREEMVWQELNPNEYEEFKIPDPSDPSSNNMINVYFTAIGDHPDAYRYFTITHPASIHQDITQGEVNAFKVMVKKVKSEMVKYSKQFGSLKLSDGTETMAPIELFGAGTDTTGQTMRGKGFTFKDQRGLAIGTYNENNSDITALLADGVDCCLKYWDMTTREWIPLVNNWAGGSGGVIFHKDKTSFTEQDCVDLSVGTNALHVGYSSAVEIDTSKGTTMFLSGLTFLGAELCGELPPVVKYITIKLSVTTFDEANCGGIIAVLTGAEGTQFTSKTDGTGVAYFNVEDGDYTITLREFDTSKYKYTPVDIPINGPTYQDVSIRLTSKISSFIDFYNRGTWAKEAGSITPIGAYGGVAEQTSTHLRLYAMRENFASIVLLSQYVTSGGFTVRVTGKVIWAKNSIFNGSYHPDHQMPKIYISIGRGSVTTAYDILLWTPDNNAANYWVENVDFDVTCEYEGPQVGAIAIGCHGAFWDDQGIDCHIYSIEIMPHF